MFKGIDEDTINEIVQIVEMEKCLGKKFKTYSLGMKERLAIANALINKPRILILDEPTNHIDINTKEIHNYNFTDTKFNIVIGNDLPTKFNFIMALIKQISKLQNINFKIVDFVDAFDGDFAGVKVIKNNFDIINSM